jgi:hypothetical protein
MRKVVIGLLAATLLVAACGGSSNKSGSAGSDSNGSTTTAKSGDSSNAGDEFSQLTAKAKTADIKITFTYNDGKTNTYAQDGKGKTAFTSGDSTIIYDGTNTISCNGTGSDATCTQVAGSSGNFAGAFVTSLLGVFTGLNSSVYGGHVSSETIAGRDARCVKFTASDYAPLAALAGADSFDPSASVTICADKETGFLLKFVGTSNNKTENIFVATSVDKSSASDFEPPSTPETMPDISLPEGVTVPTTIP